jgi:hypothetical protein
VQSNAGRKRTEDPPQPKETIMELLTQANLLFAIAGPIVLIIAINALLQRTEDRRPLFEAPKPQVAAPVEVDRVVASPEPANDAEHDRAA